MTMPEGMEPPDDIPSRREDPDGAQKPNNIPQNANFEKSPVFTIVDGGNYFTSVSEV